MSSLSRIAAPALTITLMVACKGGSGSGGDFPGDFSQWPDTAKVGYMMKHTTPDSVARFICNATIGRVPGIEIDSISEATLYAYESYKSHDLDKFQEEYDGYSSTLPLALKMKLLFKVATENPIQLGYQLGLEYVERIREDQKSVADVEAEIKEFRKACGADTETYDRFIKGFKIALQEDHGKDLPEDIYRHFINY